MVFTDMSQNSRTWATIFRKLGRRCLLRVFSENFMIYNKQLLDEVFVIFIRNFFKRGCIGSNTPSMTSC